MHGSKANWLKLPDPTIVNQKSPVKGLILWDDVIITGNDNGSVQVFDKEFNKLAEATFIDQPILRLSK